jgi:DNA repair protein SbcC/Rad50
VRIISIRGENLASLVGPFELPLDREPIASAGLFSISGPTGAGKSTLLDALCLALYGKTPRLFERGGAMVGRASDDEGQLVAANDARGLLSRGTARGFAEVVFDGIDGRRYRATWTVHRARGRAGGRLQGEIITLVEHASGQPIGDKKVGTLEAIEARVGYTFNEFKRAVVLPQFEFKAFLEADADTRAGILERVTGTEHYSELSIAAYQRAGVERAELQRLEAALAGATPLAPEARTTLEEAVAADAAAAGGARAEVRQAGQAVAWHEQADKLAGDLTRSDEAVRQARQAEAGAGDRRAALAEVRAAEPARPPLLELGRAEGEAREASAASQQAAGALDRAEALRGPADAEDAAAAGEAQAARQALGALQPELLRARALDQQVLGAQQGAEGAADRLRTALAQEAKGAGALREAQAGLAAAGAQRRQAEAWLASHAGEAGLADDWGRWQALLRRHGALAVDLGRSGAALKGAAQEAQAAGAGLDEAARLVERAAGRLEESEAALRRLEQALALAAERDRLVDGERCPLCGATEHPYARHPPPALATGVVALEDAAAAARQARQEARGRHGEAAEALAAAQRRHTLAGAAQQRAEGECARLERERDAVEQELEAPLAFLGDWRSAARGGSEAFLPRCERAAGAVRAQRELLAKTAGDVAVAGPLQAQLQAALQAQAAQAGQARAEADAAGAAVLRLEMERRAVLAGRAADAVEAQAQRRVRDAEARSGRAREAREGAHRQAAEAGAVVAQATLREERAAEALRLAGAGLAAHLERLGVLRPELERRLGRPASWLAGEEAALRALEDEVAATAARRGELLRLVEAHQASHPAATAEEARASRGAAEARAAELDARVGAGRLQLRQDDEARRSHAAAAEALAKQVARADRWRRLADVIGSSDGKRFRLFAQSLALDALVHAANRHLAGLARRYRLERVPRTDLELQVIDQDLGGEVRSVKSLSGGESFLVSLALALGLSSLSTRATHARTLFIDEGFGTLDRDTLEHAMDALDQLRAAGRTVGVISHVPELHERIGVQVKVVPCEAGRSRVELPTGAGV